MGYSTIIEVTVELASVLTSGNPNGPVKPLISIGNSLTDVVPLSEIEAFIRTADEEIDAMVSSIYTIPLSRVVRGAFDLGVNITAGDTQIIVKDASRFDIGEIILIRSAAVTEEAIIADVPNNNTIVLTLPVANSYVVGACLIDRVRFPDPIPKISARLAAANIFDKHFAAQVDPGQSNYGNQIRGMAYEQINGILSGAIRLDIPEAGLYVGRRYQNMALLDVPSSHAEPAKTWFKGGPK